MTDFYTPDARRIAGLEAQKDAAYRERDQLVAALSKLFPSHRTLHQGDGWDDEWRNVICIHLPTGQATWHIHESELPLFAHLSQEPRTPHWDGHSTEQKYARLNALGDYRRKIRAVIERLS